MNKIIFIICLLLIGGCAPSIDLYEIQQNISYFHGYDSIGGSIISLNNTVPIDTVNKKDLLYTHSININNSQITILETAYYEIHLEGTAINNHPSDSYYTNWTLQTDTGLGFMTIPGTEARAYHPIINGGTNTISIHVIHKFAAGDKLKVSIVTDDTSTSVKLLPNGSRLTIKRI